MFSRKLTHVAIITFSWERLHSSFVLETMHKIWTTFCKEELYYFCLTLENTYISMRNLRAHTLFLKWVKNSTAPSQNVILLIPFITATTRVTRSEMMTRLRCNYSCVKDVYVTYLRNWRRSGFPCLRSDINARWCSWRAFTKH